MRERGGGGEEERPRDREREERETERERQTDRQTEMSFIMFTLNCPGTVVGCGTLLI